MEQDGFLGQLWQALTSSVVTKVIAAVIVIAASGAIGFIVGRAGRAGGAWKARFESDQVSHTEEVRCWQFFQWVFGRAKITWTARDASGSEKHEERSYRFSGVFSHEFLRATYWCTNPKIIDYGAFLLKYKPNGGFIGTYIGIEGEHDARIETIPVYEWAKA